MGAFTEKLDIINRALQKVGAQRITSLTDTTSPNAPEAVAMYDKIRSAELRRNQWRFAIRRAVMRPIGSFNATKIVAFGTYNSGTTYAVNDVVAGSDGTYYFSLVSGNLNHDPTSTTGYWRVYFGPLTASEFVTDYGSGFTYASGDHAVGSDDLVYVSLADGNINHDPTTDGGVHWEVASTADSEDTTAATDTSFYAGEMVFIGGTTYLSKISGNDDTPPSSNWIALSTQPTLSLPNFIYPIGSGPLSQSATRNVFRLPYGYLREVPRDTRAGSVSALGAPTNMYYTDWEMEGDYIVSREGSPIIYRFVADIQDVTLMDNLFCEGLASRMALELAQRLTMSDGKTQLLAQEYAKFISEARLASFIEIGPVEPPLDDWLAVRV